MPNQNFKKHGGNKISHQPPNQIEELNIKWITGDEEMGNEMIEWAKEKGEDLYKKQLTTSQIRKFYGEVKRIQADFGKYKDDAPMLNAKLAYAVGRKKGKKDGKGIELFANTFEKAIKEGSNSKENFNRLVKILEATVAYHKYFGGKD